MLRKEAVQDGQKVSRVVGHQSPFQCLKLFSLILFAEDGYGGTSQAAQPELVYLAERIWILPVVLDNVDIIGRSEETCECRRMGIPERGRDDA
jgi:hypothetical protein